MMVQDKLNILEEKLINLFNEYDKIKHERDELLIKQENLFNRIKEIEAENSQLKSNRNTIKAKIEQMLQKLET